MLAATTSHSTCYYCGQQNKKNPNVLQSSLLVENVVIGLLCVVLDSLILASKAVKIVGNCLDPLIDSCSSASYICVSMC